MNNNVYVTPTKSNRSEFDVGKTYRVHGWGIKSNIEREEGDNLFWVMSEGGNLRLCRFGYCAWLDVDGWKIAEVNE